MSFTIGTTSATISNVNISFNVSTLTGNDASFTVEIDGYSTEVFSFPSTGDTDIAWNHTSIAFSQPITITSTPITVKISSSTSNTDLIVNRSRYTHFIANKSVLSTNDITANSYFTIYPNPTTNSFQLSSNKNVERVQLYNITGRLLKTFNATTNYDISDLATGIYIININTTSGSKTIKIAKK